MSKNVLEQDSTMMDFERAYKKQKVDNAQPKQALDMQLDREREWISEQKAHKDISALLTTGMFSDVTLIAGEKTAAAHKNILAARSPVFAALFAELSNAVNRVEIDIQADVLEHFLVFIYTGVIPALEPRMAPDLLAAAEKYKVEQLKLIVEDYLCGQLSLKSVVSLYSLAIALNASKLKDKCREFLNSHAEASNKFRNLDGPCLVALFRQLPPADQMTARTVCHRWADLVPYAARSTRSLAILINRSQYDPEKRFNRFYYGPDWKLLQLLRKEDGTPLYRMHSLTMWNTLQFSILDESTVTAIMATFPVLKELLLSAKLVSDATTPPASSIDHLIRLLEHLRPQLTTLKLDVWSISKDASSCNRLGVAISSLSALKHLCMDLKWNGQRYCPHLSNLPQLTHFTTNSKIVKLLRKVGPLKSAPLQLSYACGYHKYEEMYPLLEALNGDLRHRFIRIDDHYSTDYRTVCQLFPFLTTLGLYISSATYRNFLTRASQLTQLVHLHLNIHFSPNDPINQPHRRLPQLKSIKLLQLKMLNQQDHSDLEQLNIAWTMPNVQVVNFDAFFMQCRTCGNKEKHCLRLMLSWLKRHCTKLHTIKHKYEKRLGTAEEILAEPITKVALPSIVTKEPKDVLDDLKYLFEGTSPEH